ncbi:MAG: tail fiber domain-containing protein [Ferruginibacter sp.]|nr:tail fiber domain-containing protein [Ferruginibacter sp.]
MLTRILFFIVLLATFQSVFAQNVGIGTANPVNKLSVNGKVNITDSLGIGTTSPVGELQVKSKAISTDSSSIDQMQTFATASTAGISAWQSFTPGVTGLLTKVELFVQSPTMPSSSTGTIKIYAGEGISGTLLTTTTVTFQPAWNFQSFTLSNFVNVIAGNKYTISFTAPGFNSTWKQFSTTNPYAGGISDIGASADYKFKTYVASPIMLNTLVVTSGNVGIGTTNPTSKLDIAGKIKITDGSQGAGKVLTSDTNGLASWVVNTKIEAGTSAGNTTYWNGTAWVANSDNIYNNGSNVGIGTTNPTKKLSVNGSVHITDSLGIGTTTPVGELHVKSFSVSSIDQQQTNSNASIPFASQWQSFTAGVTGLLNKVDLSVWSSLGVTLPGTVKIYAGEGVSGTLLCTTNVGYEPVINTYKSFTLSNPVNIISGNQYTIEFSSTSTNGLWVDFNSSNNPYAGGRAKTSPNDDFLFKTYVTPNIDALVVLNGKIGIGTSNPSTKLDITGNVKITDGSQGVGKVLTSDANGLASWATPGASSGWGLTGNSGTSATTHFLGTTDNRSLRLRTNNTEKMIVDSLGNVGIGMINPAIKLDLDTNQIIGTSKTFVTQHDITNRGTKVSFGYSIPGNEFLGMKAIVKAGTFFCGNSGDIGFYTWECNTSSSREVMRINGSGNVGIGTLAPTAKFSVNGDANNTTGAWSVFSDSRIKTVNSDFTDGLNVINKIHTVKFNYNTNAPFKANGEQIGIVAQELEKIAPYMVSQKEYVNIKDLREVNNQAYVFLLINAVKELSVQNEQLKADLELIKNKLGLSTQAISH